MDNNPNPSNGSPKPSIANFGLDTVVSTANEGEPQRKPSEKKTSIFVSTNQNIQQPKIKTNSFSAIPPSQAPNKSEKVNNRPPSNPSNQLKKPSQGGKSPQNNKNQQKPPEDFDLTIDFGLKYLIKAMTTGQSLQKRNFDKIMRNFMMYIKNKGQTFSLDSIQQKITFSSHPEKQQIQILKLSYLKGLQNKSQVLIGLFWTQILKAVSAKLPFLSVQGCYEILKLQIGLNKHLYCENSNEGTFDVKIFMDTHLFPILNNKLTVEKNHKLFKSVESQIENLSFNLFRTMRAIFKEIYVMKKEQEEKYLTVFKCLERIPSNKTDIINNLFLSFENLIVKVDEQHFSNYISYFECVAQSLWYFYQSEGEYFKEQQCIRFIECLNENYIFFNSSAVTTSKSAQNFAECIEKLVLGFLCKRPFQFMKWKTGFSNLIFKSKVEFFAPFTYLLAQNASQQSDEYRKYYPLRGLHWKEFIDSLILVKLTRKDSEEMDGESIEFIINVLEEFLAENADIFWADPSNFKSYMDFCVRYNQNSNKKGNAQILRITLLNTLRIAISIMGKSYDKIQHRQTDLIDVEVQYPQNKKFAFAKNVHVEFAQKFIRIDQQEFLFCICDELRNTIEESQELRNQDEQQYLDVKICQPEDIIKTYFLKLLISEPQIWFELRKYFKDIKDEHLADFLIVKTIQNPRSSTELLDLAFSALDTFLITTQTSHLAENIFGLGRIAATQSLNTFAQNIFQNPKNFIFLSRHCNILINNHYHSKEWTKELLSMFSKTCKQKMGEHLLKNYNFVISYSKLLSNIVGKLNFGIEPELLELKRFISIPFVIETIKYYLRFDFHNNRYINMIVEKSNKAKMQTLLHVIRVYNTVLLYCLKVKNTKESQPQLYTSTLVKSKKSLTNQQIFSAYEARQLGIYDKHFYLQVKSGNSREDTTSYANALTFILLSSTKQQAKTLKQINSNYENLIFQTIENLVKINSASNLAQLFSISQRTGALIDPQKSLGIMTSPKSLLKEFVSYIEKSLNPIGIEIIIFGKLIQESDQLRRLIDRVRQKLQSPQISRKIQSELQLKLLATLSRYFRESMVQMSLHKKDAFTELEIQIHFEHLIQCIINSINPFKSTRKPHEATTVDDILNNLYGGFLVVQTFSMDQFHKLLKAWHLLLLDEVNLKYLRNQFFEEFKPMYILSEEYFNLLTLFLNCDQFPPISQFKIITSIKSLPKTLQGFILKIAVYSELSGLPESLCEILLQILTMSLRFYSKVSTNEQEISRLFTRVLNSIKSHSLKPSNNLILLEIELYNELQARYSSDEIDFTNFNFWPLQMNCIDPNFSTPSVRKIIESLKNSRLNSTAFVSICNGLLYLIQNSQTLADSKSTLTKDLFAVYKFFISESELLRLKKSPHGISMTNSSSKMIKPLHQSLEYKKVWILELLLAILSTSQNGHKIDNVRYDFEKVFQSDQDVLKRFGLLMRKLSFTEAETYMTWLSHLDYKIQQAINQGQHITYAQKLQLNQILKIFNFVLANQTWTSQFADGITELVEAFISYRKIFENLPSLNKIPRPSSLQESIMEGISLERQIIDDSLKSTNSFQLMHEILNIELSTQYATICFAITQTQHLSMFKKNPLLSDASKWNIVMIELTKAVAKKYLQVRRGERVEKSKGLRTILQDFMSQVYLANDQNIELSTEMLFTNSEALSCCLSCSIELLGQILTGTLKLLLERIQVICRKMKSEHHVEHKARETEFLNIVAQLKRMDKNDQTWLRYDPSDRVASLTHTLKTHLTKMVGGSQLLKNGKAN